MMTASQVPPVSTAKPRLIRALGLREGIAIHMGVIIGSGIFIVPAIIAGHVPATGPMILVWIVAGLLTLFGSLSLAELSAILPQAGGPYVYLREGFGRLWGFLFSWNDFFINKAGSAAAIAVGFATYLAYFIPGISETYFVKSTLGIPGFFFFELRIGWVQIVAISAILVVTIVNVRGVVIGGWVMTIFTSAKVLALVGLIIGTIFSGEGSYANFRPWWPTEWTTELTGGFGLALLAALWAYDGWIDVTLTAGEFRDPAKNVPRSLILGTVLVIALYLMANLAYTYVIPLNAMVNSSRVAADVALKALGPVGASLIVAGILCSTFGSTNGMLLNGPRSIFAAASDATAAKALASIHPRYHSPWIAIITLGLWSSLLTLSGTYEQITAYVVFGSWFFYGLAAASVLRLRRIMPDVQRPYKAWGYPWLTMIFLVVVGWFLVNTIIESTRDSVIGLLLLAVSLPFYYIWTRRTPALQNGRRA